MAKKITRKIEISAAAYQHKRGGKERKINCEENESISNINGNNRRKSIVAEENNRNNMA